MDLVPRVQQVFKSMWVQEFQIWYTHLHLLTGSQTFVCIGICQWHLDYWESFYTSSPVCSLLGSQILLQRFTWSQLLPRHWGHSNGIQLCFSPIKNVYETFCKTLTWKELRSVPPHYQPLATILSLKWHCCHICSSLQTNRWKPPIYLAVTRANILVTVSKLSQSMQKPTRTHWTTTKWVLRYLKAAIHHGFHLKSQSTLHLHSFSNANWGGTGMIANPDFSLYHLPGC